MVALSWMSRMSTFDAKFRGPTQRPHPNPSTIMTSRQSTPEDKPRLSHRRARSKQLSAPLSELGGIRVRAEFLAQDVADLLLGRVGLRALDDRRHQVRVASGSLAHGRERGGELVAVALGLDLGERGALDALDFGVDA